jgi:hypothetical protein
MAGLSVRGARGTQKKLAEAAAWWAGGGRDDNADLEEAMAAFGLKVVDLEVKENFEIWEINKPVLEVFLSCGSQWRRNWDGQYMALDYTALESVMNLMDVTNKKEMFEDIRTMEYAALEVMNRD